MGEGEAAGATSPLFLCSKAYDQRSAGGACFRVHAPINNGTLFELKHGHTHPQRILFMTINAASFIETYNFSNVVSRAIQSGFSPESAPEALKELKAFFVACLDKQMVLSPPSIECDELWHEFITHTRAYAAFCDEAFGEFLHHDSDLSPELLAECQDNARKIFGESAFAHKAMCGEIRRVAMCGEIRHVAA
jgi:hypothetical protein